MTNPNQPSSDEDPKYRATPTADPNSPTGIFIPGSIEEAIAELEKMLHPALLEEFRNTLLEEFMISQHHDLGLWMRNNWGLWHDSRLAQNLSETGCGFFADDMSSAVLEAFWHHLTQR